MSRRAVGSPRNGGGNGAAASGSAAPAPAAGTGAAPAVAAAAAAAAAPAELLAAASSDARKKSWNERFWTTWAMIGGFFGLIAVGHPALVLFVAILQTMMFREVYRLGLKASMEQALPYFKFLPWWWYATAVFFSYGRVLMNEFQIEVPYHTFIAFSMYAAGLCWFVLSLEQPHFKYQFSVFAWVQLTLLIIVMQSSFLIVNMFHGLIWFVLPCILIISNDTWAYFFGFFWGRTPLIALSPKKTWEGFLGGFLMTVVFGFGWARILAQFDLLICPKYELSFGHPHCAPALPFQVNQYAVPLQLQWLFGETVGVMPIQWHGIGLGVFASLIAPFGGFFASGFKRAFKIKDFGDLIPGHGGVTDRMDCQIMMGLFVWVYYTNFVREVMDTQFVWTQFAKLSADKQLDFFTQAQAYLGGAGLLPK